MAKIPFDIKYRPQIESGEYKVETREGLPVRIICWDRLPKKGNDDDLNLCILVPKDEGEAVYYYHRSGKSWVPDDSYDLFIVTPEEELTEFEDGLRQVCEEAVKEAAVFPDRTSEDFAKTHSAKLLSLAKSHLLQSGELMTQEQHEKLMETQYKETLDGVKKNWHDYFTPQAVTDIYNAGRNDVLKDLPRWKKHEEASDKLATVWNDFVTPWLDWRGHRIAVRDLEKLPGFKED